MDCGDIMARYRRYVSDIKCEIKWWLQRRFRGYSDDEVWNLHDATARFLIPRLKKLKEINHGCPEEFFDKTKEHECEAWSEVLDKMICAFELSVNDEWILANPNRRSQIDEGLQLFAKYFDHLWD